MAAMISSNVVSEKIYLNVPVSDMSLFESLMEKLGWKYESKKEVLKRFIQTRPKSVDLTDEEIMDEVRAVRYKC